VRINDFGMMTCSFGPSVAYSLATMPRPQEGVVQMIECARESGQCALQRSCADSAGEIEVGCRFFDWRVCACFCLNKQWSLAALKPGFQQPKCWDYRA
jgi:hypothetical protein